MRVVPIICRGICPFCSQGELAFQYATREAQELAKLIAPGSGTAVTVGRTVLVELPSLVDRVQGDGDQDSNVDQAVTRQIQSVIESGDIPLVVFVTATGCSLRDTISFRNYRSLGQEIVSVLCCCRRLVERLNSGIEDARKKIHAHYLVAVSAVTVSGHPETIELLPVGHFYYNIPGWCDGNLKPNILPSPLLESSSPPLDEPGITFT